MSDSAWAEAADDFRSQDQRHEAAEQRDCFELELMRRCLVVLWVPDTFTPRLSIWQFISVNAWCYFYILVRFDNKDIQRRLVALKKSYMSDTLFQSSFKNIQIITKQQKRVILVVAM